MSRDGGNHPLIMAGNDDVLRRVADELGILPDGRVKLLIYVEGPNDVAFLEHVSRLTGHVDLATDPRIAFVVPGGGNLKHWINRRYLSGLNRREVHIYDRDNDHGYQGEVDSVNARKNGDWATLTQKREIENYLHSEAIELALGVRIMFTDYDDVPAIVAQAVHEAAPDARPWLEVDDKNMRQKFSKAKKRLCDEAAARMTLAMLQERDPAGELSSWLNRIAERIGE